MIFSNIICVKNLDRHFTYHTKIKYLPEASFAEHFSLGREGFSNVVFTIQVQGCVILRIHNLLAIYLCEMKLLLKVNLYIGQTVVKNKNKTKKVGYKSLIQYTAGV